MDTIYTKNAPDAIGPYSQAVRIGDMLYTSGQIAINPATGNVEATDIVGQSKQVMANLKAVLEAAGTSFDKVVKTTCFLKDVARDFGDAKFFSKGGFWQKQQHIYMSPFYYIDYCIAQTDALQYKAKMDEDFKSAWDSYLKLCYLSASDFFTSMVEEVGLVSPFKDGCIKDVERIFLAVCSPVILW